MKRSEGGILGEKKGGKEEKKAEEGCEKRVEKEEVKRGTEESGHMK